MINNKSVNRVLAESLFNLAMSKSDQLSLNPGSESLLFDYVEGTSSSTNPLTGIPLAQEIIADGTTGMYTLNATPARPDLIDVWVNDVLQRPGETFEVVGDTIYFIETPLAGWDIYIKFR